MMTYTIDASVFISAYIWTEACHALSKACLERIKAERAIFSCPTLLIIEVAAALARQTRDAASATAFALTLADLPNMTLVNLDAEFAERAAHTAAACGLRGADAVYAEVAKTSGATLLTWDIDMLARAALVVQTVSPDKLLR